MKSRRGTRKRNIIRTNWTPDLAYAIGLIATDGNLSPDGRHINFTSKDIELVLLFKKAMNIKNRVGRKGRGGSHRKPYYVIQFGSIQFYEHLLSIGLMPAKSKRMSDISVPDRYFWDFLRGCLDGDGNINEFRHPESRIPQLRIRFVSASRPFLMWSFEKTRQLGKLSGGWLTSTPYSSIYSLTFGKSDSIAILKKIYYRKDLPYLKRKFDIGRKYLSLH